MQRVGEQRAAIAESLRRRAAHDVRFFDWVAPRIWRHTAAATTTSSGARHWEEAYRQRFAHLDAHGRWAALLEDCASMPVARFWSYFDVAPRAAPPREPLTLLWATAMDEMID